jgi:hypothetical protein
MHASACFCRVCGLLSQPVCNCQLELQTTACDLAFDTLHLPCLMHPCALAEFVGCSPSLSGAIRVNPWSILHTCFSHSGMRHAVQCIRVLLQSLWAALPACLAPSASTPGPSTPWLTPCSPQSRPAQSTGACDTTSTGSACAALLSQQLCALWFACRSSVWGAFVAWHLLAVFTLECVRELPQRCILQLQHQA